MSENKIKEIKERIKAQIESIKAKESYLPYSLNVNGHISGLESALTIIEDIEPDIKIPLYKSEHVKLSIVGDIK